MAKQENRDLEMELLQEKLKNLEQKMTKPQTSEEAYQQRVAAYESKAPERELLKAKIEQRRMELWTLNPKARQHEIIVLEAWERRAEELAKSNPGYAAQLKANIKRKIKEINEAYDR